MEKWSKMEPDLKLYFIIGYFITIKYLLLTNHDPFN